MKKISHFAYFSKNPHAHILAKPKIHHLTHHDFVLKYANINGNLPSAFTFRQA